MKLGARIEAAGREELVDEHRSMNTTHWMPPATSILLLIAFLTVFVMMFVPWMRAL